MLTQLPPFPVHEHKCCSALYRISAECVMNEKKDLDIRRTENPIWSKSGRDYLLILHPKSALYCKSSGIVPHSSVSDVRTESAGSVHISIGGMSWRISQSSAGPEFQTLVCPACPLESCMLWHCCKKSDTAGMTCLTTACQQHLILFHGVSMLLPAAATLLIVAINNV